MPETKFADMEIPENWAGYVIEQTAELSAFLASPIVEDLSESLGGQLAAGLTVEMPFFKDLDGDDEQLDDEDDLQLNKVNTGRDVAHVIARGKVFSSTDLAADLSGADPINMIGQRFGDYWARMKQKTLLAAVGGAMGAASMDKNVLDISAATGAAAYIDAEAVIDAVARMGDAGGRLTGMAMHSETKYYLEKLNLIEEERDSDGRMFTTYRGKTVIVDDGMPKAGTGADAVYDTYLFGPGAIGWAEVLPKVPVETGRDPLKSGGLEYIVNRTRYVIHPRGIKWKGSPAKKTPSNVELANSANWERVYEPKNIRMVKFRHKIGAGV